MNRECPILVSRAFPEGLWPGDGRAGHRSRGDQGVSHRELMRRRIHVLDDLDTVLIGGRKTDRPGHVFLIGHERALQDRATAESSELFKE